MDNILNKLNIKLLNNFDEIKYQISNNETIIFSKINDSIISTIIPYYNSTYSLSYNQLAWCILNDIGFYSINKYPFDELDDLLKNGIIKKNQFYDWGKIYRNMELK